MTRRPEDRNDVTHKFFLAYWREQTERWFPAIPMSLTSRHGIKENPDLPLSDEIDVAKLKQLLSDYQSEPSDEMPDDDRVEK